MKKILIEYTQMVGKEPEKRIALRENVRNAKTFYNNLLKDPNVKNVVAYDLTVTTFGK